MFESLKEDIGGSHIYRQIARKTLRELHHNLLDNLRSFFSGRENRNLVVAGHGPEALPYSNNLDIVEKMIAEGNIAMFDYNPEITDCTRQSLIHPMVDDEIMSSDKKKGLMDRGFSFESQKDGGLIDLRNVGEKKVVLFKGDLLDKFQFADGSVSAFDATLSIHHATSYIQGLEHIVNEVYRILEPGGLFHFGDGNTDMRYQESKIHDTAIKLKNYFGMDIALTDRRDPTIGKEGVVANAFFDKEGVYDRVPLMEAGKFNDRVKKSKNVARIEITKEGWLRVDADNEKRAKGGKDFLIKKGYKLVEQLGNHVLLPIIDAGIESDREFFLESVREYYLRIMEMNSINFRNRPDIINRIIEADNREYGNAVRGLFEYYTMPDRIIDVLLKKGFKKVSIEMSRDDVWFNICAIK